MSLKRILKRVGAGIGAVAGLAVLLFGYQLVVYSIAANQPRDARP